MFFLDNKGHLLAAVDVETTGLDPKKHDIIQLAIVPLNEQIQPNKSYLPVNFLLKPLRPENVEPRAFQVNKLKLADLMVTGLDPFQAADLLEEWFERLRLPIGKKLIPLGQNYTFDQGFLREWLGALTYDHIFHYHYKDTMITAGFLKDRAVMHGAIPPFDSISLTSIANKLGVETTKSHDALNDCLTTAECYRRMLKL